MLFWLWGKSGGLRHGGSLGFGELSCFPARTSTHQDFSLHLFDCGSEELQRGQRELPSGQSLQFSLSALPFGHTAWLPEKETSQHERQCRAGWKPGGGAASVGRENVAQLPCKITRLWKKHVDEKRIDYPQSCVQFCS